MIVLRLCGGPIIYFSILAMILGTAYGGFMLFNESATMMATDEYKPYYLYGSYVVWGISAILLCCACCNLKNIRIGVAVMKCTASFLGGTPQVFLVPPLSLVFILAWLMCWLVMAAYIISIGTPQRRTDFQFLTEVVRSQETDYVFLYSLFGYLWLNAFMIGVT
jgi:solute carrier family 44 (choline transporter-like protein), member 2/4/5